ncbi:hypothetical protein PMSD_09240 [Paenibacillus macquariensis subsp. defensor]|nr:hypothetical protein PMSD_09240 [Paenibacillus macquariensis subsp. defensor]
MKYHYSVDMETDNSLSIILKHVKPNSKVFEFGPSDGYMTEYLKNTLNCEIYCLEIDEQAAEKAKEHCDNMFIADLNQMNWIDQVSDQLNTFDYLIFADVLEHLLKPEEILKVLTAKLLNDTGKVLISLPHIGHTAVILELLEGKFEYRETGLLDRTHLNFFTRQSVERLLQFANLQPIEWHNVNMYPEQTELMSSYHSVPIAVEQYLRNKIDAHVYQFVTISEKKVNNELFDILHPFKEKSSFRYSEFVQLFWSAGEGFIEENSLRLPLMIEGKYHTYNFEFQINDSNKDVLSVRLDPTNFPCFVHLRSFKLLGLSKHSNKFEVIDQDGLVPIYGSEIERDANGLNIFAYNEDPQLQKDLDRATTTDYRHFRVEVELSYHLKLEPHLLYKVQKEVDKRDIKDRFEELLMKVDKTSVLENEIKERKHQIEMLNSEYLEMNKQNQVISNQLKEEEEQHKLIQTKLDEIHASLAWRLTSQLRRVRRFFLNK